jgi:16S rRNA (uracil1498-N3)-methyltransferase
LTVPRLYFPRDISESGDIVIQGHYHHYLSRVLRMRKGQEVILMDGAGRVARAAVREMSGTGTLLRVLESEFLPEQLPRLRLFQALLPPAKMDRVVQDCAEAGVSSLVPFSSRRSRKPDAGAAERLQRWRKIALESWRRSGRPYAPEIGEALDWDGLMARLRAAGLVLYADEAGGMRAAEALQGERPLEVALVTGPEGGFSDEEREALSAVQGRAVTLGSGIFRAETAGLALTIAAGCHYQFL